MDKDTLLLRDNLRIELNHHLNKKRMWIDKKEWNKLFKKIYEVSYGS